MYLSYKMIYWWQQINKALNIFFSPMKNMEQDL